MCFSLKGNILGLQVFGHVDLNKGNKIWQANISIYQYFDTRLRFRYHYLAYCPFPVVERLQYVNVIF